MPDAESNSSPRPPFTPDPVLDAMGGAVGALRRFADHTSDVLDAFERAASLRQAGAPYRQIAEEERLFIDFACGPYRELLDAVSGLRRRQVRVLYEEGMTMAQLGRLLGVTRQRIAVLLADKAKPSED